MSGVGSVYRRGPYWWLQWFVRDKRYRESTKETSKHAALAKLREKLAQAEPPTRGKLTFQDLVDGIVRDYQLNGRRSARRLNMSCNHLRKYFGGTSKAEGITRAGVRGYCLVRSEAGAANGTINRELSALKRMLALAVEDDRLAKVPHIKLLDEAPARQGFFEHEQYLAVQRHLPDHLKDPVTFLYLTGWRLEEMQSLEWRDVDLVHGVIRLRAEKSKNKEPRILRLAGELAEVIARAHDRRRVEERIQPSAIRHPARDVDRNTGRAGGGVAPQSLGVAGEGPSREAVYARAYQQPASKAPDGLSLASKSRLATICPYVFHRNGHKLKDFRASWKAACRAAGVPGRLRHDFRRSAYRNMIRAGVPDVVARRITGHKTRSVADRYNIVSDQDLGEAQEKLTEYLSGQQSQQGKQKQ